MRRCNSSGYTVCQPDRVAALDVIGGMCRERGCRTVQPDKIARCLNSFKERSHNGRHLLLAEIELLILFHIVEHRIFKLFTLNCGNKYICFLYCFIFIHKIITIKWKGYAKNVPFYFIKRRKLK